MVFYAEQGDDNYDYALFEDVRLLASILPRKTMD